MQKLNFHHPIPTSGRQLYSRVDRYRQGAQEGSQLKDQIFDLADRFIALDGSDRDLSPKEKHVQLQSPGGRVRENFTYSERVKETQYRDREGYWETNRDTKLSNVAYRREELNAKGEVTKEVVLSYVGPEFEGWSMTITDKHGTSIASARDNSDYQVAYFAK